MNGRKAKEIRKLTTSMNPQENWLKLYKLLKEMYKRGKANHI
jgi:hypothetical protein